MYGYKNSLHNKKLIQNDKALHVKICYYIF